MKAATQISQEQAREEVGRILLAQDDLGFFAEYVSDWYVLHEMHRLMAYELMQVLLYLSTGGEQGTQFLMVLTPPQHGKSAMVSQFFPAFALGKLPDLRITEVSYGDGLATKNSRAVRNLIVSPKYQAVFGALGPGDEQVILSNDSRSVSEWALAAPNRGGMVAAGMGGAITGQPKGLFIWDDPIKDHREAAKKEVRDDAWDFYKSAMRVRMSAGVLVMTHWHPDDPAGKILKEMVGNENADQWKVLDMPALMEPGLYAKDREEQRKKMSEGIYMSLKDALGRKEGEVLCAAMLSKKEMLKMRAGNEYFFTALFQQRPYLREGQRYKRDWFQIIPRVPEGVVLLCIVRYWDKAASPGKGDYAVGALEALGSDFNFYFLDVVRDRVSTYERDKMMLKTAKRDAKRYGKGAVKIWHPQDPGSAGIDSALATNRLLRGYPAFFEPVTGSKETRSETLESSAQGKAVFLIQAPWNEEFIEEFTAFNSGTHDDQVDAGSSAHNKLLEMMDELDVEPPTEEIVIYQERVSISPM